MRARLQTDTRRAAKPTGHSAVMAFRDPSDGCEFFPTPPWGARAGAELIKRIDPAAKTVWEPAAGAGHMAHGLRDYFDQVFTSDAFDYGLGDVLYDFTRSDLAEPFAADWIVSNPPFASVETFIRLAYARARRGAAMLMRLAVLEGQARYRLLHEDCPLHAVAPFSERLPMHKARWEPDGSTASAYAWFFWFKRPQHRGRPALLLPIAPGSETRLTRPSDAAFAMREAS